jgi:hypothetical protein
MSKSLHKTSKALLFEWNLLGNCLQWILNLKIISLISRIGRKKVFHYYFFDLFLTKVESESSTRIFWVSFEFNLNCKLESAATNAAVQWFQLWIAKRFVCCCCHREHALSFDRKLNFKIQNFVFKNFYTNIIWIFRQKSALNLLALNTNILLLLLRLWPT